MSEFWCYGCGERFEGEPAITVVERYAIPAKVRALATAEGQWGAIAAGQTETVLTFVFDGAACYQQWQAQEVTWKTENADARAAAEAQVETAYAALTERTDAE